MKQFTSIMLFVLSALLLMGYTQATESEPRFADVPPCHWAAEAVNSVADANIFIGFPPDDRILAVNAVRQVFAGLWCGESSWSLRFLKGAPVSFGEPLEPEVLGFEFESTLRELTADEAVVGFTVDLVLDEAGAQRMEVREGTAVVVRDNGGWRVRYESLVGLELDLFPAREAGESLAETPPTPTAIFRGGS